MYTALHRVTIPLLVITFLIAAPLVVTAETVLRAGESVTLAADQRVEDDFYAAGGTVAVSGQVVGDMYAVGGSVTTNGAIGADLAALGGSVQVHAPVADDVRVLGGEITIAEPVEGDVFVIGGSLTILSSATIGGDVFFYGGEATVNGAVAGSIMGAAERFRIDAAVGGDVDVRSSRSLVLGERASVGGDVRYASFGDLTRATNAVVEGEIIEAEIEQEANGGGLQSALIVFFIHAFAILSIYLLARPQLIALVRETLAHPSRSAVIGLAAIFIGPAVAILLMVTVLGLLLGLASIFLLVALALIAYVMTAAVTGGLLARFTIGTTEITFLWVLAGAAVLHIALLVPVIGFVVVLTAMVVTLGALIYRIYRTIF